jgi:hypothetical protein
MDWERLGKDWAERDSAKFEQDFRKSLTKLDAEGATNIEIAAKVIESPFILGLTWAVTTSRASKKLVTRYGRAPENWQAWVEKHNLRDDWRAETVSLLRRKCERDGMLGCKLDAPKIGGFWRRAIIDKAVKAAWALFRKEECKLRKGRTAWDVSAVSDGDGFASPRNRWLSESLTDFEIDSAIATAGVESLGDQAAKRLCLLGSSYQEVASLEANTLHHDFMVLIGELDEPREQEVMRLSLLGMSYRNIEGLMADENGQDGKKITFEMVRYAYKKGVAALQARLGLAA